MKIFLLAFLLGFVLNSAHAQVSAAAALIVLDEVDAKVSKQLQTIDNLATNAIGNTGNMILSASARLRKDINETIGNTDKALRENQLNLYNQLLSLSSDFSEAIQTNLSSVDLIATRVTATLDNFLIKEKEPRIYKYESKAFIKSYDPSYTFKVVGKNFDQADNIFLKVNNKVIKPSQLNYSELIFKVDSTDINSTSRGAYLSNTQIVFEWTKGLFNSKKQSIVPFIIPTLPLHIGDVTVFYEHALPERKYSEPIDYNCNCSTGSSSWSGSRRRSSTAFNILPTGGRLIDPASISVKNWNQRYGGGNHFDHKTEQQIKGVITCQSEGQPYGGGGFSTLTFSYREYEIVYPNHKKSTEAQRITSVNPVVFDLPDPVDGKRPNISYAKVKTFDNKEFVLVPNAQSPLFDLRLNPVTDDVVVSWKK